MKFEAFQFHPRVLTGVQNAGYVTPTLIQQQAIPPVMEGKDVMGLAQTGTGKTAVFILPILHRLMEGPRRRVRALIIAPTRELAEQIHETACSLGGGTAVKSLTVYGGVNINPQINRLHAGVEIVVACPGRLLDHLGQKTIDLSQVEVLVIDEADRMFDMGFLPDVRRILKHLPPKRQTLLFSATMPDDVRKLAHDILRDPVTVQIGHGKPAQTVSHALYPVTQHLKTALLIELLRHTDTESVIIFTRTKHRAKRVAQQLEKAGHQATSLQGNLSQNKRQASLDGFRDGSFKIMVATDIASRGIDVTQISHVINYDIPDTVDAYTHRIGRTGRVAKTGDAFTLVTGEDEAIVRGIERILGEKLERRTMPGFDYRAAAPKKDIEFARPPREARHQPSRTKVPTGAGHRAAPHARAASIIARHTRPAAEAGAPPARHASSPPVTREAHDASAYARRTGSRHPSSSGPRTSAAGSSRSSGAHRSSPAKETAGARWSFNRGERGNR